MVMHQEMMEMAVMTAGTLLCANHLHLALIRSPPPPLYQQSALYRLDDVLPATRSTVSKRHHQKFTIWCRTTKLARLPIFGRRRKRFSEIQRCMGSSCWDCWAIVEGLQFNECPSECGSVAEWLGHWTCDSNPALLAIACTPRQVVNTRVRLSSSSITWY